MKTHGTVIKWNDERGFGFVRPENSELDIFTHISEFPKDGIRPRIGETISFEIETGLGNKSKAVRIGRAPGIAPRQQQRPNRPQPKKHTRSYLGLALATLVLLGFWLQTENKIEGNDPAGLRSQAPTAPPNLQSSNFQCDGRTLCSQMHSCAEATYFIQNCPNTQMDGNNDGEPCELQWCH